MEGKLPEFCPRHRSPPLASEGVLFSTYFHANVRAVFTTSGLHYYVML